MKENYLETHLEPPVPENEKLKTGKESLEELPESVRHLFNPDIKYNKSGNERVELKNGWVLEYTYEELSEQEIDSYAKIYENTESLGQDIKSGKFRKLTNLSIKDQEGKDALDLMKNSPIHDIFFYIDNDAYKGGKNYKEKIFSYSSPNSFLGIMTIMHEVGHAINNARVLSSPKAIESLKAAAKRLAAKTIVNTPAVHWFLPKKINDFAGKNVLREERDAWAVSVSTLRGTLDAFDVSEEDFKDTIHKTALITYSERIRQL